MKILTQILRGVLFSPFLFILISLVACKTSSTTLYESNDVTLVYIKELPMDSIITMFQEDVLLVTNQTEFTYLAAWYRRLVTQRLLFTEYEKSLFFYIVDEEANKLNFKLN